MGNEGYFWLKKIPILRRSNYALWKVRLEAYLTDLYEANFLSLEYNTYDEFNEEAKNIILNTLLDHDVDKVSCCKTTK